MSTPITVVQFEPASEEIQGNIRNCAANGLTILGLSEADQPQEVMEKLDNYIDAWQEDKFFARLLKARKRPSKSDAEMTFGSLWGEQLVAQFGWTWGHVSFSNNTWAFGVVSPDRAWAVYPMAFIKGCLHNRGVDCTAALAFSLLAAGKLYDVEPGGFENLVDGVHRLLPRRRFVFG